MEEKKISVSDLSVGDWVRYDNGVIPYSIRSIVRTGDQECVVLKDDMYPDGITGFVKYLKPIPITAEILEKNGWSEFSDYHNSWKLDVASDKRVWMFKNSHDWTFQVMSWGLGHNHSVAKAYIKDIHELQHALRLAKVGKEIVL